MFLHFQIASFVQFITAHHLSQRACMLHCSSPYIMSLAVGSLYSSVNHGLKNPHTLWACGQVQNKCFTFSSTLHVSLGHVLLLEHLLPCKNDLVGRQQCTALQATSLCTFNKTGEFTFFHTCVHSVCISVPTGTILVVSGARAFSTLSLLT